MKKSIADTRKDLADLVNRAHYGDERIFITKHAKPVACIVSDKAARALGDLDVAALRFGMQSAHLARSLAAGAANSLVPLSGRTRAQQLAALIDKLGVSPEQARRLLDIVSEALDESAARPLARSPAAKAASRKPRPRRS